MMENKAKAKIEIELPVIEGFEYTGEYRDTNTGDFFFQDGLVVEQRDPEHVNQELILRKIEPETLLDRIKAQYPDFEVVELVWGEDSMRILPCGLFHTSAQSMKNFYEYVYFEEDELYASREPTDSYSDRRTVLPKAVLFSRVGG